jgi:predicted phosphodiesterase
MAVRDHLRGPVSLLALSASYALRKPTAALPALRVAMKLAMRARSAPRLRRDRGLLASPDEIVPVVSLVSDTHLVAPRRSPCELDLEPEQWLGALPTADELTPGLRRLLEHLARHAPRTVIWCGDVVDSGDPDEWRAWRDATRAVPGLAHRVAPGNHDICFNRPFDPDYDLARRAVRERTYQQHAGRLADFPVIDTIIGDAGPITIALLDSCRHRSTHVLSNAVGMFGDDQIAELARQLDKVHGPVLVATHHHVWRDRFAEAQDLYNVAIDADALVDVLAAYSRRHRGNHAMIVHGHRHVLDAGWIGDVAVVAMPSSTLGDKPTGVLDGIMRYGVAGLRRDGTWGVAFREVGPLLVRGEEVVDRLVEGLGVVEHHEVTRR